MSTTEQATGLGRIATKALDHVALWVADRDELADFLCGHLGMHVIDRTDAFTLVGADARRGKLTLFAEEGPREPGLLARVILGVSDLDGALAGLPEGLEVDRPAADLATFEGPQGLGLGLCRVPPGGVEYDVESVVLRVPVPDRTYAELEPLGFEWDGIGLELDGKRLLLEEGDPDDGGRPLLNHIALLVESAAESRDEAERRGVEVADFVDAANTVAVFVWGPERIKLEYVEHKPGFSLT
ncbi:MAG TPA: VOC family protein [Thermoleophilaceae bacterium]|jgi:catechol 2,3-dioxygenase-like lactoylglutathione lyase family enzyme